LHALTLPTWLLRFMSSSPDSEYAALIGSVVDNKYLVERLLGAGGMGLVFLAQHVELGRPVAVKLIRRELMETESVAERFLREARAAARIQSEHVGRVLDVGRLSTGEPFIVMEYLLGEDLAQLLLTQRLEPAEAVDLLLEACEAIAEAHQMRIVHRDLKPENLFLAQKPDNTVTIKVLDFGISKQLGEAEHRVLTKASTTLGSPQYMAPEQMEGGHVDVRADVWALGAILYEMLTGRRAFEGETLAQVCVQVLSGKVTPLQEIVPDVPSDLADAIAQCLRPARDERFVSVAALANALAPFGTARSRVSANRIASVLGVRATDPASRNSVPPPTQQSVLVDALQRTEVGAPSEAATSAVVPASSRTVGVVNRRRGRTSIVLGLAAVALVGASVWWLGRGPEVDAGPPVSAVQALEVVTPAPLPRRPRKRRVSRG
jgi:eukaryotic-like serine/threonine-protein kinase